MTKTLIGTAIADANGVATITYESTGAGDIYIVAECESSSGTLRGVIWAKDTAPMFDDIHLYTSEGDTIFDVGETVVLKAQLLMEGAEAPVSGVSIDFVNKGTVLATGITNDEGLATVSYLVKDTEHLYIEAIPSSIQGIHSQGLQIECLPRRKIYIDMADGGYMGARIGYLKPTGDDEYKYYWTAIDNEVNMLEDGESDTPYTGGYVTAEFDSMEGISYPVTMKIYETDSNSVCYQEVIPYLPYDVGLSNTIIHMINIPNSMEDIYNFIGYSFNTKGMYEEGMDITEMYNMIMDTNTYSDLLTIIPFLNNIEDDPRTVIVSNGYEDIQDIRFNGYNCVIQPAYDAISRGNLPVFFVNLTQFQDLTQTHTLVPIDIQAESTYTRIIWDLPPEFYDITLTSDKDILSQGDSATITAQLLMNNEPATISNHRILFEIRKVSDDSLIQKIPAYTNNNGVATMPYFSQGAGDIYIKANFMFVSKRYELTDYLYKDSTTHNYSVNSVSNNIGHFHYDIWATTEDDVHVSCIANQTAAGSWYDAGLGIAYGNPISDTTTNRNNNFRILLAGSGYCGTNGRHKQRLAGVGCFSDDMIFNRDYLLEAIRKGNTFHVKITDLTTNEITHETNWTYTGTEELKHWGFMSYEGSTWTYRDVMIKKI